MSCIAGHPGSPTQTSGCKRDNDNQNVLDSVRSVFRNGRRLLLRSHLLADFGFGAFQSSSNLSRLALRCLRPLEHKRSGVQSNGRGGSSCFRKARVGRDDLTCCRQVAVVAITGDSSKMSEPAKAVGTQWVAADSGFPEYVLKTKNLPKSSNNLLVRDTCLRGARFSWLSGTLAISQQYPCQTKF